MLASLKNDKLYITFQFDWKKVEQVKQLAGRKFSPKTKAWTAPINTINLNLLKEFKAEIHPELHTYIKQRIEKKKKLKREKNNIELPESLYDYQKDGVKQLIEWDGNALLADEMGLGKTIQALTYLEVAKHSPAVIVVPASLKLNWKKEARKWTKFTRIKILKGKKPFTLHKNQLYIVNYDIIHEWKEELIKVGFKTLITDECHKWKNNKAKRTKAIKILVKNAKHQIHISGTPILNKPIEIYNAVNSLSPDLFGGRWAFAKRYCDLKHNGFGWDFDGYSNVEELNEKLISHLMIRRLKKNVLTDLPDKIYSTIPLEIKNKTEYNHAATDIISYIQETQGEEKAGRAEAAEQLAAIEKLKQLAVKGKLKECLEWISDFLESGKKLVVFATHKEVINAVMAEFGQIAVKIDGSVDTNKRQNVVNKFQENDNIKLFVGNIQAAGVGITLTAASNVLFLEYPWTPAEVSQAIDRCHRIGQEESVQVHYTVAVNTIEEQLIELIDKKLKVSGGVLDGNQEENINMTKELIKQFKN